MDIFSIYTLNCQHKQVKMIDENVDPKGSETSTVLIKLGGENRKVEAKIAEIQDDPRVDDQSYQKALAKSGKGQNTESFDPSSTLVRPDARVIIGKSLFEARCCSYFTSHDTSMDQGKSLFEARCCSYFISHATSTDQM